MNDTSTPLLFALNESRALGVQIGRAADLELAPLEERPFEQGEFKLRPGVSVRDRTVFVVQSLAATADVPVAQRLVRLLFCLFGLRDAGARRTIAVVPYLAYARQDSRTQPRDTVNTRYVAQLLEAAGLNQFICLDVHNPAALDNSFRIPVVHLAATSLFVSHFAERHPGTDIAVASPDVGGIKRAQIFREQLQAELKREVPLVFVEKRRSGGTVSGGTVVGDVADRTVIVLDDMCASGRTLIRAATTLREAGASAVCVAFTHAPIASGLVALAAEDAISEIVFTDSVGDALEARVPESKSRLIVLSIAPLLANAIAQSAP